MGRRPKRRGVDVLIYGQIAKVSTIARGGVAVTVNVGPDQADWALKAGKLTEIPMKVEFTIMKEDADAVDS